MGDAKPMAQRQPARPFMFDNDTQLLHCTMLNEDPRLFATVLQRFADGLDEGCFPAGRRPPLGTESAVFYLVDDIEAAGFATFYLPEGASSIWLDLLWVEPEFREGGIGTMLIRVVADLAGKQGVSCIEFGTSTNNAAMNGLARKLDCDEYGIHYRLSNAHG